MKMAKAERIVLLILLSFALVYIILCILIFIMAA